jgi:hypothetical protein
MRDFTDEPAEVVAAERSRVASKGWGAQLLDQQRPDGNWGDDIATPHWRSNLFTLLLLRDLGLEPTSERARRAVGLVRDRVTWGPKFGNSPFFEGEVEPCINGHVLVLSGYFGETDDRLVDRLLSEQLTDGGWNCEGAETCLLERRLFRRLSSGDVIDRMWARFRFPTLWHYDVLRGLDYLRRAGVKPDERVAEAIGLVAEGREADGRWLLEEPHRDAIHVLEVGAGHPSRWITLRALRVLDWYSSAGQSASQSEG